MRNEGEKGYPWLFFRPGGTWGSTILVTAILLGLGGGIFLWYNRVSADRSPDSIGGYGYAIAGTLFMVLAAIGYTIYRRSRKRGVGQLHNGLNWHIAFGVTALVLLFLHSFGNFNPRTGTYALYGMIAMVISGIIGRTLDHFMPRMITEEVQKALTAQGEDRIESISQRLQSIVVHNTQEIRSFEPESDLSVPGIPGLKGVPFMPTTSGNTAQRLASSGVSAKAGQKGGPVLQTSWDLAYISLEETPQELSRDTAQYRFVPDRKSALARPGALLPGAQEHISALKEVQQALAREQFYRYVIRYWRIFHIVLALVTIGLTLWHIEYAVQLLIPVYMPMFLHH
ncbi:hypothetical protein EPA93_33430 [Ktedonosporobacter rubrisoli]|uniref:Uncharacterized protein n=1 Tax=Ktedonosporobacter rubrisoli TaxID=2509675 RepID=A0A4P6JY59_KTERU|nr:hypothetical protein [Ktedonosporobacter rubrisoli]QBD80614.1 hypothetical protein EPA93_33430 [Ktedonosporobacter rubrisoli]